jgi:xylulose-5-phosphate/fructose-6-phosphate phosphoketolase
VPRLRATGVPVRERLLNEQIDCLNYAHEYGIDRPEVLSWKWQL